MAPGIDQIGVNTMPARHLIDVRSRRQALSDNLYLLISCPPAPPRMCRILRHTRSPLVNSWAHRLTWRAAALGGADRTRTFELTLAPARINVTLVKGSAP